jgi:hypothetical protein
MPGDLIQMNMHTWTASSSTTATGKSNTDDLVNDVLKTLNDLINEMSPVFFLHSMQNLQTAIEEFGQGMSGALACVSVDLQVVANGLSSAVSAFGATDKALANTFAHLETQLGYYTNTATSTTLPTPTTANRAALDAAYQQYYGLHPNGNTGANPLQQQDAKAFRDSVLGAAIGLGVVSVAGLVTSVSSAIEGGGILAALEILGIGALL